MARRTKSVEQISKNVSKKGRIKGKNKKETKALIGMCPHHKYNKNGKLKPTIFSNDGEYCIGAMCGAKFPASFYKNEEIGEIVAEMKQINNQNKFTAVATNAGNEMNDYFAQMGVMLQYYKKNSKKVRNVAEKQGRVKEKKKKQSSGSSMYGSWGRN